MADSIQIINSPSVPVNPNNNRPVTIVEPEVNGGSGNNNIANNNEVRREDKVDLSEEARNLLEQNSETNVRNISDEEVRSARQNVENNSIEFRGIKNIAEQRDLNSFEVSRLDEIREEINTAFQGIRENISDEDILRIADRTLARDQEDLFGFLERFQTNNVTNIEFERANQINRNLNRANGFGIRELSAQEEAQLSELRTQFDEILNTDEERRLQLSEINLLEQVESAISAIEGSRLNVKQTVGPDGLVA